MTNEMSIAKNSNPENILSRLKIVIEADKLKQVDIVKKTHYRPSSVSQILSGKIPPNPKFLSLFCSAFEVSQEWILTGKGDMKTPTDIKEIVFLVSSRHVTHGDYAIVWYSDGKASVKKVNLTSGSICLDDAQIDRNPDLVTPKISRKK